MSNINVRKENGNKPVAQQQSAPSWEPLRLMRDLLAWDPFREMAPMMPREMEFSPSFEIKETPGGYVFKADVPGVKESDIEVTVTGSRLSISGKREAETENKGDTFYTYERSYGSFRRSFTLPEGVDTNSVRAELKDGVLTLDIKKVAEAQPKKIPIGQQQGQGGKAS